MINIVGQTNLIKELNSYSTSTLPHSILLLGSFGSGKHTIAKYISQRFEISLADITNLIGDDNFIDSIYDNNVPYMYLMDLDKIVEKNQNRLLKIVEEPPLNCYLVLLSSDKNLVIETLLNRCRIFQLESYSLDELKTFTNYPIEKDVFETPGQILNFNFNTLDATLTLVDEFLKLLKGKYFSDLLLTSERFNYKEEYDKINLDIFLNILLKTLREKYKENKDINYYNYYLVLDDLKKAFNDKRYNRQTLFENYLVKLWRQ